MQKQVYLKDSRYISSYKPPHMRGYEWSVKRSDAKDFHDLIKVLIRLGLADSEIYNSIAIVD